MRRPAHPFGNAAKATRRVSSGALKSSCGLRDMVESSMAVRLSHSKNHFAHQAWFLIASADFATSVNVGSTPTGIRACQRPTFSRIALESWHAHTRGRRQDSVENGSHETNVTPP